jgi:hypothetical protein
VVSTVSSSLTMRRMLLWRISQKNLFLLLANPVLTRNAATASNSRLCWTNVARPETGPSSCAKCLLRLFIQTLTRGLLNNTKVV